MSDTMNVREALEALYEDYKKTLKEQDRLGAKLLSAQYRIDELLDINRRLSEHTSSDDSAIARYQRIADAAQQVLARYEPSEHKQIVQGGFDSHCPWCNLRATLAALGRVEKEAVRLVHCVYCNKTHAVRDGDIPCGGLESNWVELS